MSALSQSVKYDGLLIRFAEVQKTIDDANLKRYHQIGALFDEFCGGIERQAYGDCTVQKLADDLQRQGVLSDITNPIRYLYWSRAVYTFDPTYDLLGKLSNRGFSVTHAKLVFSLDEKVRTRVINALLEVEQVPSTRELESQLRLEATSEAAKAVAELSKETTPEPPKADPPPAAAPSAKAEAEPPSEKGGDDKKEKKEKEKAPKEATVVDAEAHPLKAIKALEKLVSKMVISIPDGFIAVRTAEKKGFDSDKAEKNYRTELSNLVSAVNSAIKPLAELKALLDEVKSD